MWCKGRTGFPAVAVYLRVVHLSCDFTSHPWKNRGFRTSRAVGCCRISRVGRRADRVWRVNPMIPNMHDKGVRRVSYLVRIRVRAWKPLFSPRSRTSSAVRKLTSASPTTFNNRVQRLNHKIIPEQRCAVRGGSACDIDVTLVAKLDPWGVVLLGDDIWASSCLELVTTCLHVGD